MVVSQSWRSAAGITRPARSKKTMTGGGAAAAAVVSVDGQ
jgi:hypothetical protein